MERTSLWKQAIVCAVLIAGAVVAWHARADLATAWASVTNTGAQDRKEARSKAASGIPVIVSEVREISDDLGYTAIGTGFAQRSVTLRAPVGGEVMFLAVEAGKMFEAGDILMRLDDTDERLAVDLAQARLERAEAERDRYQSLEDTGVAARARFEQVQTDYKVARIELEKSQADLARRTLRSPFAGVAGIAAIEKGDRIQADDPIASYDDRSQILVEFDLPEALLGRVSQGVSLTAETPAQEGRTFDGTIVAIDSQVGAATRSVRVRAAIDNSGDMLRPGASFLLKLDLPGDTYWSVPELALQFAGGALYVWRVAGNKAEQVELRLVRRRDGMVIVDGPLVAGDRVVIEGNQRLRSDIEVNVLNIEGEGRS